MTQNIVAQSTDDCISLSFTCQQFADFQQFIAISTSIIEKLKTDEAREKSRKFFKLCRNLLRKAQYTVKHNEMAKIAEFWSVSGLIYDYANCYKPKHRHPLLPTHLEWFQQLSEEVAKIVGKVR